jgi:hypothetical protein
MEGADGRKLLVTSRLSSRRNHDVTFDCGSPLTAASVSTRAVQALVANILMKRLIVVGCQG